MKEIAIEIMEEEIRMILVKDGKLEQVLYERQNEEQVVNRIYKGIIRNILPGMEAAFVDIGTGRNAYLKLQQPIQEHYGKRLFVGQSVLVQIVKEEMLGKAARVTTDISLAGRFVVLLPFSKGKHISKRISNSQEREHLKILIKNYMEEEWGFIVRTSASQASTEEIEQDLAYLKHTWQQIQSRFNVAKGATELYRDADFYLRIVRDFVTPDVSRIIVDDLHAKHRIDELLKGTKNRQVEYYSGSNPLFATIGMEEELQGLVNSRVPLPSGGELCIERTEALTIIDVNSKSYIGKTASVEDTALAVNKEAAIEACRQLRLRQVGGMILIDFIDLHSEEHKNQLLALLRRECAKDQVKTVVCGITSLGLVEMTRKRGRIGLEEMLTDICPHCGGTGYLLSAQTVYLQILRKCFQVKKQHGIKGDIVLQVHPEVAAFFTKSKLKDLEGQLYCTIKVESNGQMNREAYALLTI